MVGAIWKPLAPAPMSANRVPRWSTVWSHRAEWNDGPANVSMPGMSGIRGVLSAPTALMTARASSTSVVPSGFVTVTAHRPVASSKAGRFDPRVEPAVTLEVVRVHHPLEVGPELGVLREVLGPVIGRLERVAVEVAADVDPCARVAVLPPRAAGSTVLLDDRERQTGLREANAGEQAGLAAPDDDHVRVVADVVGDLVAPRDRAGVGAVEVQVLEEHRHDVVGDRAAREERHHLVDELVATAAAPSTQPRSRYSMIAGSARRRASAFSASVIEPW